MKILFLIVIFTTNCIGYLSHLGNEQLVQIWNRERIQDILDNPTESESLRSSLEHVQRIKEFGIQNLALSIDSGFEYYVPLSRKELGWNVSGSYPLEFKSYTWWFPIAGEVPYKGFFDYQLAIEEEEKLKRLGLDTRVRVTGGYSTLGWLSDPIFSSQLEWSRPDLSALIIHEMAHATYYIPGDSVFNESYAEFVEKKGIELYYSDKSNPGYKEWIEKKNYKNNSLKLIKNTAKKLKSLYESDLPDSEKLEQKKITILEFKNQAILEKLIPEKFKTKFLSKDWNNEDFIGAVRYKSGGSYFEKKFLEAKGNFSEFHKLVREYEKLSKEEKEKILDEE